MEINNKFVSSNIDRLVFRNDKISYKVRVFLGSIISIGIEI